MSHIGVVSTLVQSELLPRIISGSSAGSIVASLCCTRTDDELPELIAGLSDVHWDVFQDSSNPDTIYRHISRLLKVGSIPVDVSIV